ncbi:hypothetical protein EC991_001553 [Linnemannia zychae]|nr:hypothetical protein EC991_001553 [Linnemannia zychae]
MVVAVGVGGKAVPALQHSVDYHIPPVDTADSQETEGVAEDVPEIRAVAVIVLVLTVGIEGFPEAAVGGIADSLGVLAERIVYTGYIAVGEPALAAAAEGTAVKAVGIEDTVGTVAGKSAGFSSICAK